MAMTDTAASKFKLDFTVNIPLLMGGVGAIVAGSMWVSSIEARLTSVENAIKAMAVTQADVTDLKAKLGALELRGQINSSRLDRLEAAR